MERFNDETLTLTSKILGIYIFSNLQKPTKSNGHNSLKVEPAKSYQNTEFDFTLTQKLLLLVCTIACLLHRQGGNHV